MLYFSYRNKQRLRTLLLVLLIALGILAVLAVGIFFYLQRYIVYTPTGAYLDLNDASGDSFPGNPTFQTEHLTALPDATLELDSGEESVNPASAKIYGLYVTVDMLSDPDAVLEAVDAAEDLTAVMVDVKSIFGNYYYTSSLPGADTASTVNPTAVDQLIASLASRDSLTLVARLPAFRDSAFALEHQECGLPLSSGALWMDEAGCYWLDPADDKVLNYLQSVSRELQALGFDEIVFSDFAFPESQNIVYDGDRSAAVLTAAQRLCANLQSEDLTLSFASRDPGLAQWAGRLYVTDADGSEVASIAASFSEVWAEPGSHLVFVTDSRDTRFSEYGLLRPAMEPDA